MTLYEELELTPNCSPEDIKYQYRALARLHHPDLGGDEEKFKRIKFAYEVLSDPVRRKQYDETKTTSQPTDSNKEAITHLAGIFFAIIPSFDCLGGNLVEAMKNEVTRLRAASVRDLAMNQKYIDNIEIIKGKLKTKDPEKENILLSFVEKQLETRISDKKMFEYRINLSDIMLEILDTHQYGFVELVNEVPVATEAEPQQQS